MATGLQVAAGRVFLTWMGLIQSMMLDRILGGAIKAAGVVREAMCRHVRENGGYPERILDVRELADVLNIPYHRLSPISMISYRRVGSEEYVLVLRARKGGTEILLREWKT